MTMFVTLTTLIPCINLGRRDVLHWQANLGNEPQVPGAGGHLGALAVAAQVSSPWWGSIILFQFIMGYDLGKLPQPNHCDPLPCN